MLTLISIQQLQRNGHCFCFFCYSGIASYIIIAISINNVATHEISSYRAALRVTVYNHLGLQCLKKNKRGEFLLCILPHLQKACPVNSLAQVR